MVPASRRQLLLTATTLGSAGLAVLAATRAFGFSLEEPNAEAEALYLGRCAASSEYHAQLLAELEAKLMGHSRAEIEAAIAAAVCPICGCPLR